MKSPGLAIFGVKGAWRAVSVLAATAGGVDSISLSAVARYTAHMSGTTSGLVGALVGFTGSVIILCLVALIAFLAGATTSGLIIAGRSAAEPKRVAFACLLLESALLATGSLLLAIPHAGTLGTAQVVAPLAAAMGLQNRTGVYLAGGKARTTHVTGTLTDLGYHIGRSLQRTPAAHATRSKDHAAILRMTALFAFFLGGGVMGRLGFMGLKAGSLLVFAALPFGVAIFAARSKPSPGDQATIPAD